MAKDDGLKVVENRFSVEGRKGQPDGSQPHELARTRSFTYATMNATLFCELALLGEKIGVDLWCYETSDALAIYQHFT